MSSSHPSSPRPTIVFDIGAVLLEWNPRHLYRKLFPDEAAMEGFLAEVEGRDARGAVDDDVGMAGEKAAEARDQPAGGEGRQHGEVDDTAGSRIGHGPVGRVRHRRERLAQLGGIDAAGIGQDDAPAHPVEQADPEIGLQMQDLPGNRALRQMQFLCRAGYAAMACGGFEGEQVGNVWEQAAAQHIYSVME